jgi:hypothetical protein
MYTISYNIIEPHPQATGHQQARARAMNTKECGAGVSDGTTLSVQLSWDGHGS